MINIIKKEMAINFLRHYVRTYMITNNISDTKEAVDRILHALPILAFSGDSTQKIGANFIVKNKFLFTYENLYPANGEAIRDFENLFNVPAVVVNKILPVETCNFINIFHTSEDLKTVCRDNDAGVDDNIFRLFPKKINWDDVREKKFSEDFVEENKMNINWKVISLQKGLTEEFMNKHPDKLNMNLISELQKLSEKFMDYHKLTLNWDRLSHHQIMCEDFIHEHANLVNWDNISFYQNICEDFVDRHADKINFTQYCKNKHVKLSTSFINKHFTKFNLTTLVEEQMLDENFIQEKYECFKSERFKSTNSLATIFRKQKLSKSFIDKHTEDIKSRGSDYAPRWEDLFDNPNILYFDFKGTIVYKNVSAENLYTLIANHKGAVMFKLINSNMYFRTVFVRNKNSYRVVQTDNGYKNWSPCTSPLGSCTFTFDEVVAKAKSTVIEPVNKE